jgi:hypothetical protein
MNNESSSYWFYHSHGICVRCKVVPARKGKSLCASCAEEENRKNRERYAERKKQYSPEFKRERALKAKAHREELKAKGLCPICGKKAMAGHYFCIECRNRSNRKRGRQHISLDERKYRGLCLRCNQKAVDGYYLCEKHIAQAKEAGERGRESQNKTRVFIKTMALIAVAGGDLIACK